MEALLDKLDCNIDNKDKLNNNNSSNRVKIKKPTYIYYIYNGASIKCGISTNVKRRLKQLQTGNSVRLSLIGCHVGTREDEKYVHEKFYLARDNSEWIRITDDLLEYMNGKLDNVWVEIDEDSGKLRWYTKLKR